MPILQALVLGLVQGATEFIPVSSSAHLVLVPFIFGWHEPTVAFDVAVHAGTLISVLYVFWGRVAPMLRALRAPDARNRHLLTLLFIGTLPAGVAGLAFTKFLDKMFERPVATAALLGVTGWLLLTGDRISREHEERVREEALVAARIARNPDLPAVQGSPLRATEQITPDDALVVGAAQAVAILPGISRSGATVVAALKQGLTREAAVLFSFLLSIPAILGAIVVKLPDIAKASAGGQAGAMIVGLVASTLTGIMSIRWFLRLFTRSGLRGFGIYCFLMMAAAFLTALARG